MNEEKKEREEMIYFRTRADDGKETAYVITETEFKERFADFEVIERKPILILRAK